MFLVIVFKKLFSITILKFPHIKKTKKLEGQNGKVMCRADKRTYEIEWVKIKKNKRNGYDDLKNGVLTKHF